MPNREGGYGGYQSSQPQQNRMPRKVNAPGSGKVRRGGPAAARAPGSTPPAAAVVLSCAAAQPGQRAASPPM